MDSESDFSYDTRSRRKAGEQVIQHIDLFCSAQVPPLGAETQVEITGSGSFPANERWGVFETRFETPNLWGPLAAEVLLDLKQE